jgi:iduronate 2-sulfatase
MKHPLVTRLTAAILLGALWPGASPPVEAQSDARAARRRNVLLIVVDDLNTALGCYGNRVVRSPNIDRLAARGVRFERAYAQYPVCNPSRNSFLSGLRPEQTGVLDNETALRAKLPDVVTLPQLFRQNGWFTAEIAKVFHVSQWDPPHPADRPGSWRLDDPLAWDYRMNTKPSAVGQRGARRILPGMPAPNDRLHYELIADGGDDDQEDGEAVRKAVELMNERRDQPFFIGVGLRRPHAAWVAPKKYFDLYPKGNLRLPEVAADERARKPAAAFTNKEPHYGEADKVVDLLRAYYASLTFMDAQVGRLMEAMDRMKLWDNTVVVLMGDHGFHLGEHGLWHKGTLFEGATRAPLIVVAPGAKGNGQASPRVVEFVDLYPTLADLCGLGAPEGLAGRSLRPLLDEPKGKWDGAAYSVVTRRDGERRYLGRSVRTAEWRYTEWDGGRAGAELYDHRRDPLEIRNLVNDTAHERAVAELKRKLLALSAKANGM